MYIVIISYPGSFLNYNNDRLMKISSGLALIEREIFSAAITVSMYEHAKNEHSRLNSREEFFRKRERRSKISDNLRKFRAPSFMSVDEHNAEMAEVDKIFLNEELTEGRIPSAYLSLIPEIHAKSFVLSLQMIVASISRLREIPECSKAANEAHEKIVLRFPHLSKVRNSIAHADERVIGKATRRKKTSNIDAKPIDSLLIKSSGNTIVTSCFENNDFLWTLDDGSLGRFPINLDALEFVASCVQGLINSLEWRGAPKLTPHA
jgi:hypothetical protein